MYASSCAHVEEDELDALASLRSHRRGPGLPRPTADTTLFQASRCWDRRLRSCA